MPVIAGNIIRKEYEYHFVFCGPVLSVANKAPPTSLDPLGHDRQDCPKDKIGSQLRGPSLLVDA